MILIDEFGIHHAVDPESDFGKKILNLNLEPEISPDIFRVPFKFIADNMEWGWWSILKDIDERRKRYDVDNLLRPPATNPEWSLDDMATASNEELGQMLSYFGSQRSYLNAEVGYFDARLTAVRSSTEQAINMAVSELEKNTTGRRPLKDSLAGDAIKDSPMLRASKRKEIELDAQYKLALGYRDAWDKIWAAASREMSRRQLEVETGENR